MDPDLGLLERWRAGDRRAGEALFARHFADVYRFFEHKVGDQADDLAQDTFMGCLAGIERFRGSSTFRTYLFAIARNQLYTFLRRQPGADQIDLEQTSIAELVTSLASRLHRARGEQRLHAALAALPVELQLLLELYYWYELDAVALGEVFGATPGAVRIRLMRARHVLRDRLGRLRDGDAGDAALATGLPPHGDAAPAT